MGDEEAFATLEQLAWDRRTDSRVQENFANVLEEIKAWNKAIESYRRAATLETHAVRRAQLEARAAMCSAYEGEPTKAVDSLLASLLKASEPQARAGLLESLSKAFEIRGDQHESLVVAELSLDDAPNNTSLRFHLAYNYSVAGDYGMALYHYAILAKSKSDGPTMNNLGVARDRLGLVCRAVTAYRRAASTKAYTLATANLAEKYREAGFADEAVEIIGRAFDSLKPREVHGNVGKAKEALDSMIETEERKETEIISQAEKTRAFRIAAARALIEPLEVEVTGEWNWGRWAPLVFCN
jgi:tetratricopeptide (TPR) repeat protein